MQQILSVSQPNAPGAIQNCRRTPPHTPSLSPMGLFLPFARDFLKSCPLAEQGNLRGVILSLLHWTHLDFSGNHIFVFPCPSCFLCSCRFREEITPSLVGAPSPTLLLRHRPKTKFLSEGRVSLLLGKNLFSAPAGGSRSNAGLWVTS